MCLITKQICPIRARKDIIVYKVLEKRRTHVEECKFYSPYIGTPVTLNTTLYARGPIGRREILYLYRNRNHKYEITSGYIHCYTSINNLRRNCLIGSLQTVVMGIIPKDTLYYISWDKVQICATQVNILNEIPYRTLLQKPNCTNRAYCFTQLIIIINTLVRENRCVKTNKLLYHLMPDESWKIKTKQFLLINNI